MSMRIALAQWKIEAPVDFGAFAERIATAFDEALDAGAQCVVLPEYLALELASTLAPEIRANLPATLSALQAEHERWATLFLRMARGYGVHVVAGTFLLAMPNGNYRNRAYLFAPDGRIAFQDKLTLTAFERDVGVIESGDALKVFDTRFGRIAINVCYDCEFPLYAHAQALAGARVLLVPSCTDTPAGATRVRVGGMARALENRIHVAQSVTAGNAPDNPALDINTGSAAVYVPSDRGMPADGVLALAKPGETWLIADLDLDQLAGLQQSAQVSNAADWEAQLRPAVTVASVERL